MPYTEPFYEHSFYRIDQYADNSVLDREFEQFLGVEIEDCWFRTEQACLDAVRAFLTTKLKDTVDKTQLWVLFLCTSINPVLDAYLKQIAPHCA